MASVPKQLAHQRQILAGHDGLTGGGVAQVMQTQPPELRIVADCVPAGVARLYCAPAFSVAREQERVRVARASGSVAAMCARAASPSGTARGPIFELR